jgi:hypothetical protein
MPLLITRNDVDENVMAMRRNGGELTVAIFLDGLHCQHGLP